MLTFDDGPTDITLNVAKELEAHNMYGIFFLVATEAKKYPEVLEYLKRHGHEIGYHCFRHIHPLKQTPWQRYHELIQGYEILKSLGCTPKFYRPPHGFYTFADYLFLKKYRLQSYHWYSLVGDWEKPSTSELLYRLQKKTGPGHVLVLHDGSLGNAVPDAYQQLPTVLHQYLEEL